MTIRVVLADDHAMVRGGLRFLLEALDGVSVVGEANDGIEAIEMVRQLRPDALVMDIGMPRCNGIEATAAIVREFPETRVLVLSMHGDNEYVRQVLGAGAVAYLLKDSATVELDLALRAVLRDEVYLSPAVTEHVVAGFVGQRTRGQLPPVLTPRQREILAHIADGRSTKQIAMILGVSNKTVESHRAQLMERLDIHDVAGLVRYALRTGVVTLHS